jgi:predicted nucleic acid-binding protein
LLSLADGVEALDPDAPFLLAMAPSREAHYRLTGDRRVGLLQRGTVGRTRIVAPAAFCAVVLR